MPNSFQESENRLDLMSFVCLVVIISRFGYEFIGIHNGHCLIGGEWVRDTIVEDAEDPDILLSSSQEIEIPYYVPHSHAALVLLIEYDIGVPLDKNPTFDVHRTVEMTKKESNIVATVTAGSAAYIPMTARGTIDLSNNTKNVNEQDKLDVELSLRTDELCGILSPYPLFNWRTGIGEENITDENEPVLGFDLLAFTEDHRKIKSGYTVTELDQEPAKDRTYAVAEYVDGIEPDKVAGEEKEAMSDHDSDDIARPRPKISKRYRASDRPRHDDDQDSLMDSIVGGDSEASVLRLDKSFYALNGDQQTTGVEDGYFHGRDFDDRLVPKDRNSLLGRSLQIKLAPEKFGGREGASVMHNVPESTPYQRPLRGLPMEDDPSPITISGMQRATTSKLRGYNSTHAEAWSSSLAHARDLSRGSRARLGRHGFVTGAQGISTPLQKGHHFQQGLANKYSSKGAVDLESEACDPLALNEVSFLFAGYRCAQTGSMESEMAEATRRHQYSPRSIYFTFQFFSCSPTRTEIHRLLPADVGEMNVLCRDEPHGRDEQPVSYRFSIDCSESSPLEAIEFAEYLARCSLQIDVWDADSMLLIGSSMFPLRRLLRQRQQGSRCALECDIVDADFDVPQGAGGVSSLTIADGGGPVSGTVVGSINIIAENLGSEGRRKTSAYSRHLDKSQGSSRAVCDRENEAAKNKLHIREELNPIDGLNWRAMGVDKSSGPSRPSNRPKNIVRARPLSESSPELSKALKEQMRYAGAGPSLRSLTSVRGTGNSHTVNYDDILLLFKRFKGSGNGTVQYEGKLLSLLDVPSLRISLRKLSDAVSKAIRSGDNIEAVSAWLYIIFICANDRNSLHAVTRHIY